VEPTASDAGASKSCCACLIVKPLDDFHRYKRAPDGRQYKCRDCCAEYQRRYNEVHGEKRAATRLEQGRVNRARGRLASKAWNEANPDKRREAKLRRRARLAAATVGTVNLDALSLGNCPLCGDAIDATLKAPDLLSKSVDHIIPLSRGGTHEQSNLQWTHLICNMRKGNRVNQAA